MTRQRDDSDIAERFRRLRAESEQAGRVPDFRAMMDRAVRDAEREPVLSVIDGDAAPTAPRFRRRGLLWAGGAASAALAATVAALLLTTGRPSPDEEFERLVESFTTEAEAWRSPTVALLDVPGISLVRTVPSVGRGLPGVERGDRSSAPGAKGRESTS